MATHAPTLLVFFDGACGLCNGFVDFLVARDPEGALRFASLQGQTAASYPTLPAVDSVIVDDGTRLLVRSDAAIAAIAQLGGAWSAVRVLQVVPRAIRDSCLRLHRAEPAPVERAAFELQGTERTRAVVVPAVRARWFRLRSEN
ncbi:thiol-disulfide oxidoreductase DCC family protein [Gemmatimonas sp.]|uniref:thiol-disulfide oxidoreductase DCC family protein n=1 Tax=Gemmatimonas sp. TaxID=1962908 RepID=UPI003DA5A29B